MLNRFFNFYNRSQVLIITRQVKTLDIMTNAYYFMIEKLIEKKSKYCYLYLFCTFWCTMECKPECTVMQCNLGYAFARTLFIRVPRTNQKCCIERSNFDQNLRPPSNFGSFRTLDQSIVSSRTRPLRMPTS